VLNINRPKLKEVRQSSFEAWEVIEYQEQYFYIFNFNEILTGTYADREFAKGRLGVLGSN